MGTRRSGVDSTFWNRCRGSTAAVVDTLAPCVRASACGPGAQASVAFAEQMARLAQHDADVGLRHLPRHETVAEHILWLANSLGSDANLLVWGRDVESGRLTGEGNVSSLPYRSRATLAIDIGTWRSPPVRASSAPSRSTSASASLVARRTCVCGPPSRVV